LLLLVLALLLLGSIGMTAFKIRRHVTEITKSFLSEKVNGAVFK